MKANMRLVAALVSICLCAVDAADIDYQWYDLGKLAEYPYMCTGAINDAGTIAGASPNAELIGRAVVWDNGTLTDIGASLPIELGYFSSAWGISSAGAVVGGGVDEDPLSSDGISVYWRDGIAQLWPVPEECRWSELPYAINQKGTLGAGYCNSNTGWDKATVYNVETGEITLLGDPPWLPYSPFVDGFAFDVNDGGVVVGGGFYETSLNVYGFTWSNGVMSEFKDQWGCGFAAPIGINNHGHMILSTGTCGTLRYRDGEIEPLSPGSAEDGAINDRSDIVGSDIVNFSEQHPMVYYGNGVSRDLIEFMPDHYIDPVAIDINNYGWIVGWAWGDYSNLTSYGWLLVPIYPKGDYDGDDDVDLHDFAHFQRCYAAEPYQGPEGGLHVGCSVFDFDDDVDLDGDDYAAFQEAFTGAITSGW